MTQAIQTLIHHECRLLDEGKLDDWLALYTKDCAYWLPIDETADPLKDSSVIYDNHLRLSVRVEQMMREKRVSQTPVSSAMRMVTNLEVIEVDADTAEACFNLLVLEMRSGDWRQQGLGDIRQYPGHCTMRFRREDGGWKIQSKTVVLLNRKQPIVGLSFLL